MEQRKFEIGLMHYLMVSDPYAESPGVSRFPSNSLLSTKVIRHVVCTYFLYFFLLQKEENRKSVWHVAQGYVTFVFVLFNVKFGS